MWTWTTPGAQAVTAPLTLADLDGDARRELLVGDRGGTVHVLDPDTGVRLWSHSVGAREIEAVPVVGDLDGDGHDELVLVGHEGRLEVVRPPRQSMQRRRPGR